MMPVNIETQKSQTYTMTYRETYKTVQSQSLLKQSANEVAKDRQMYNEQNRILMKTVGDNINLLQRIIALEQENSVLNQKHLRLQGANDETNGKLLLEIKRLQDYQELQAKLISEQQ